MPTGTFPKEKSKKKRTVRGRTGAGSHRSLKRVGSLNRLVHDRHITSGPEVNKDRRLSLSCAEILEQNGGRGGRGRLRRGGGGRLRRGGCRPRQEEEALLQGAPLHDVRLWRRPEPVHGVRGHPGGSGDRVHHGNDPQGHVHRTPGPRPGGGHRFPDPQRPSEVRQSQRPADHERGAEESQESFRRGQLWLLT